MLERIFVIDIFTEIIMDPHSIISSNTLRTVSPGDSILQNLNMPSQLGLDTIHLPCLDFPFYLYLRVFYINFIISSKTTRIPYVRCPFITTPCLPPIPTSPSV